MHKYLPRLFKILILTKNGDSNESNVLFVRGIIFFVGADETDIELDSISTSTQNHTDHVRCYIFIL